ncbi:hypothetical protein CURTO8I2_150131 [Curtobacterium sp. 8I-2]|nr:hypothetical protein CURTO8I2_150131 [Curtobacterium sp. 8I-2]
MARPRACDAGRRARRERPREAGARRQGRCPRRGLTPPAPLRRTEDAPRARDRRRRHAGRAAVRVRVLHRR